MVDIKQHKHQFQGSPRERTPVIDRIVFHEPAMSSLQPTLDTLSSKGLSVHYCIDRDGSITQHAPESRACAHAGGNPPGTKHNIRSIGIEVINRYYGHRVDQTKGPVTKAFAEGASMLAPSLAPLAALPVLAAAGVPATAAAVGAGVVGGGLFGASQFQDTYERGKQAGLTDEAAQSAGLKTAAIEAAGETIGGAVIGRFLTGATRFTGSLFGKTAVPDALQAIRDPSLLLP